MSGFLPLFCYLSHLSDPCRELILNSMFFNEVTFLFYPKTCCLYQKIEVSAQENITVSERIWKD